MKKFYLVILTALICIIAILPAYSQSDTAAKNNEEIETTDFQQDFPGMDRSYEGPLPWEGNTKFQEVIKKNNTPVRMSAYKATLHDPILGEGYNIGLAADQLAGTTIQPGKIFSQNQTIGPYTKSRGYSAGPTYAGNSITTTIGGGVCKIASLLYNVVTLSDLKVVMRSAHSMTVPYVPPGQDATVYDGVKDFRFMNNTDGPIVIWAQKVGDTVFMATYGCVEPPKVTWHHKVIKKTNFWTFYRKGQSLSPGEERVVMPGQCGLIVKSWVTVEYANGIIVTKKRGTSYYSASPRIIERGPQKQAINFQGTMSRVVSPES